LKHAETHDLLPFGICDGKLPNSRVTAGRLDMQLVVLGVNVRVTDGVVWLDAPVWLESQRLDASSGKYMGFCEQNYQAHFARMRCHYRFQSGSGRAHHSATAPLGNDVAATVLSGLPWRRPYAPTMISCKLPLTPAEVTLVSNFSVHLTGHPRAAVVADFNVQLDVCRKDIAKQVDVTSCSVPFFGMRGKEHLLQDWLEYHLAVGVDRVVLYDLDGSTKHFLAPYIKSGKVELLDHFPRRISSAMATRHKSETYCGTLVALNHCLFSYGPLTHVIIEIHSPDEYWHVVDSPGPNALKAALSAIDPLDAFAVVDVPQLRFGSLPALAEEVVDDHRARVPSFARFLKPSLEGYTWNFANLLNPRYVSMSDMHGARPRPYLQKCRDGACIGRAPSTKLRVNHYADLFGPSGTITEVQPEEDRSALWALALPRSKVCGTLGSGCGSAQTQELLARVQRLLEVNASALLDAVAVAEAAVGLDPDIFEIGTLHALFTDYDTNNDRKISKAEFLAAFDVSSSQSDRYYQLLRLRVFHSKGLRIEAHGPQKVLQTFGAWDQAPQDGQISYKEWGAGLRAAHVSTRLQQLESVLWIQ